MTFGGFRRGTIYTFGALVLLVIVSQVWQLLTESPAKSIARKSSGPECVSTTFGAKVSSDGYLEGVALTNCETNDGVLLSYHLYDEDGDLLDFEGIRFPSVTVNGNQVGFFRIPLDSLRHFPAESVDVVFDWVIDGKYWFSRRYSFTGRNDYRFVGAGIPYNIVQTAAGCRLQPINFRDGAVIEQFEALTAIGEFRAVPLCDVPQPAFLTYHLLDEQGMVLRWDVAEAQNRILCTGNYGRNVERIAAEVRLESTVYPVNRDDLKAAARAIEREPKPIWCFAEENIETALGEEGELEAPLRSAEIWREEERLDRIVFDLIVPGEHSGAGRPIKMPVIHVNAALDRIQTLVSLIPRILPANDHVLVPALIKVERDAETPTPFRVSVEVFDAVAGTRYETERSALSSNPDNTYQFHKLSFRAPPPGVWNLSVGYVFDPYMWYSYVRPTDSDRVVFINPLVFMLLVLLSLFVLRGLLRFYKEETPWYGKLLTAGAMLGVLALFGLSAILSIAGLAALMVYLMLKLARSRSRQRDPWVYFVAVAFAFGVLMEAFWSVHYADVYRHGVVLSAVLHAFVGLLVVLIARTDRVRRIALATWFLFTGMLYLVMVSYLKFFGEPPRYSIYQYAGQAMDVADSALVLVAPREWLGIGLVIFSVVLVLVTKAEGSNLETGES